MWVCRFRRGVATETGLNAWLTVLPWHNFRPLVMFLEDLEILLFFPSCWLYIWMEIFWMDFLANSFCVWVLLCKLVTFDGNLCQFVSKEPTLRHVWEWESDPGMAWAMSISRRQRSRKEAMAWGPIEFTVRQHCMVRTMSFCVCCQERAEACLHLRESHALAKDVVRKADFYRRCLFERCKVGKVPFLSVAEPCLPKQVDGIQLCFGQVKWKEATGI